MFWWMLFSGVLSGLFIGLFFKVVEMFSGIKVYTLLLNIDFLTDRVFSESIEFIFHCVVSVILTTGIFYLLNKMKWKNIKIVFFTVGINLLIGGMIYPITLLSNQTPEITSIVAFGWWLIGHLLYGLIVGNLFIYRKKALIIKC